MTDNNSNSTSRLDRIEALLERVVEQQADTQQQLNDFIGTANTVLARSAILDDVVLELREATERHQQNFERHQQNFERHQQNFENNQRSIEAALNRLEAMVLQIIRRFE
jgi:hypothetical protein